MRDSNAPQPRARRSAGFTLIELMLTVALIGVLAAIAIPSFQRYSLRSKRVEAIVALSTVDRIQTGYFNLKGVYAGDFDELGFDLEGANALDPQTLQASVYTYTISTAGGGSSYQAFASGNLDPSDPLLDILMIQN